MLKKSCSLFILANGLLLGCSTTDLTPKTPRTSPLRSVELYLSRAALGKTEFEQYKLIGKTIYSECGEIRRGRHVAKEQKITSLSTPEFEGLATTAWAIESTPRVELDLVEPGDNDSLFDPGRYEMVIKSENQSEIKTSLDSITAGSNRTEKTLRKLAQELRASSASGFCGNPEFYGIG